MFTLPSWSLTTPLDLSDPALSTIATIGTALSADEYILGPPKFEPPILELGRGWVLGACGLWLPPQEPTFEHWLMALTMAQGSYEDAQSLMGLMFVKDYLKSCEELDQKLLYGEKKVTQVSPATTMSISPQALHEMSKLGITPEQAMGYPAGFVSIMSDLTPAPPKKWYSLPAPEPQLNYTFKPLTGSPSIFEGAFSNTEPDILRRLRRICPGLGNSTHFKCPGRRCKQFFSIPGAVMHLNDYHRWNYGRIADWLETLDVDLTLKKEEKKDAPAIPNATPEAFAATAAAISAGAGVYWLPTVKVGGDTGTA